jgi:oligopeptide/dipeptide ABC transporter ATP-binding protein
MSESSQTDNVQTAELLRVGGLTVEYKGRHRRDAITAVDAVDLAIARNQTVGLVGESGSGKSSLGRAILGLAPIKAGAVTFEGRDITHADHRTRRELSRSLQAVFQDPYSSLNPARTVGQTLGETVLVHERPNRQELTARISIMLERVGLPSRSADRFPREFSGGQRQRIAIARALMLQPKLVICDEPVSALDLSVQAQVLNLLRELQKDFGLSYLFVSHDLAVVRHVSHRIVVFYRGQIMEEGDAREVHADPVHPYTRMLLAAAPVPDPALQHARRGVEVKRPDPDGEQASQVSCPFSARCPHATSVCRTARPRLETVSSLRRVACHRWRELTTQSPPKAPAATGAGS